MISAGLTLASLAYIITHLCIPFYCTETGWEPLVMVALYNPVLLFPAVLMVKAVYKHYKLLSILNVILALVAISPILFFLYENIESRIASQKELQRQAVQREIQLAQLEIAKAGAMKVDSNPATLTLIHENDRVKEYVLKVPLIFTEVPEGLNGFNIFCKGVEVAPEIYVDAYKFHPECSTVVASKINNSWNYEVGTWQKSGLDFVSGNYFTSDTPFISVHMTAPKGVPLPDVNFLKLSVIVPFEIGSIYDNPGSVGKENATFIEMHLPVNIAN